MLATTSLTPLLVNLQRMTSKPNAGGGSKDRVTWKVEEAVHKKGDLLHHQQLLWALFVNKCIVEAPLDTILPHKSRKKTYELYVLPGW